MERNLILHKSLDKTSPTNTDKIKDKYVIFILEFNVHFVLPTWLKFGK